MKIDIRFPFTIVKTDYLEKMEREFERCRFTIEKEKVSIEKCKKHSNVVTTDKPGVLFWRVFARGVGCTSLQVKEYSGQ